MERFHEVTLNQSLCPLNFTEQKSAPLLRMKDPSFNVSLRVNNFRGCASVCLSVCLSVSVCPSVRLTDSLSVTYVLMCSP